MTERKYSNVSPAYNDPQLDKNVFLTDRSDETGQTSARQHCELLTILQSIFHLGTYTWMDLWASKTQLDWQP